MGCSYDIVIFHILPIQPFSNRIRTVAIDEQPLHLQNVGDTQRSGWSGRAGQVSRHFKLIACVVTFHLEFSGLSGLFSDFFISSNSSIILPVPVCDPSCVEVSVCKKRLCVEASVCKGVCVWMHLCSMVSVCIQALLLQPCLLHTASVLHVLSSFCHFVSV